MMCFSNRILMGYPLVMNNRVAKMYRWALEIDYKHDDLP